MSRPAAIFSRRARASDAVSPAGRSIRARTPGPSWATGDRNRIGPGGRSGSTLANLAAAKARTSRSGVIRRADGATVAWSIHGRSAGAPIHPRTAITAATTTNRVAAETGETTTPVATAATTTTTRVTATGTRLWTRWFRWRDRCRYSRASSRAAADQRSSRPSASLDQRARPTAARAAPRGAHRTARTAYSGTRRPWNAATRDWYDPTRRLAATGCAIHPGANRRPPRAAQRSHPDSAASSRSSRTGRSGTTLVRNRAGTVRGWACGPRPSPSCGPPGSVGASAGAGTTVRRRADRRRFSGQAVVGASPRSSASSSGRRSRGGSSPSLPRSSASHAARPRAERRNRAAHTWAGFSRARLPFQPITPPPRALRPARPPSRTAARPGRRPPGRSTRTVLGP